MTFLVDTNILLYAANAGSDSHAPARKFLERHLRSQEPWCTTWPILYEFLRLATHRRVFPKPLTAKAAWDFVEKLISRDEVSILTETSRHAAVLGKVFDELAHPAGNLFHDIHTAALMREHGVREIVTADTDFLQFTFLSVTNPLRPGS